MDDSPCSCALRVLALALATALAACAGNGDGLDSTGRPIGEGGGGPSPGSSSFQQIQDTVFTPICTACHAGANAPLGLRLDAANSYALLVNFASVEVPSLSRVSPGDPDNSYIVQKIEGRAAVGGRMPLGQPALPQASIDLIKQWIAEGAPAPTAAAMDVALGLARSSTAAMGAEPGSAHSSAVSKDVALGSARAMSETRGAAAVTASAPAPTALGTLHVLSTIPAAGELAVAPVNEVLVVMSEGIDPSLVSAATLSLISKDENGSFGDSANGISGEGTEHVVPLASAQVSPGNPSLIVLRPASPLPAGSYQLVLKGSGATALAGTSTHVLDGNADGTSGDDFTMTFDVGADSSGADPSPADSSRGTPSQGPSSGVGMPGAGGAR